MKDLVKKENEVPTYEKLLSDFVGLLDLKEEPRRVQKILHLFFLEYFRGEDIGCIPDGKKDEIYGIYRWLTELFDDVDKKIAAERSQQIKV